MKLDPVKRPFEDREGRPCLRKRGINGLEGVYDVNEGIKKSDKFTEVFVTRLYTAIPSEL